MATVCVVGAGEIGGSVAHALARLEQVGRVVLIDESGTVAAGKALDIQQSGAIEGFHTRVSGSNDTTRVTGCAVCVITDPARVAAEWDGDAALAMMTRLKEYAGNVPFVLAGAGDSQLLLRCEQEAGFERRRLIGSAPDAFAAAAAAIVALEGGCSPSEVTLSVLGAPPGGLVVPWSEASISGYALERVLTQVQIRRVQARVARLWPPGSYSLGLGAARVAAALVTSSRRTHHVLTVLGGEFGVRDRVGIVPCLLGPSGIAAVRVPSLNQRERVDVETALNV